MFKTLEEFMEIDNYNQINFSLPLPYKKSDYNYIPNKYEFLITEDNQLRFVNPVENIIKNSYRSNDFICASLLLNSQFHNYIIEKYKNRNDDILSDINSELAMYELYKSQNNRLTLDELYQHCYGIKCSSRLQ